MTEIWGQAEIWGQEIWGQYTKLHYKKVQLTSMLHSPERIELAQFYIVAGTRGNRCTYPEADTRNSSGPLNSTLCFDRELP